MKLSAFDILAAAAIASAAFASACAPDAPEGGEAGPEGLLGLEAPPLSVDWEADSDPDFFAYIAGIAIDSRSLVYVHAPYGQEVTVLNEDLSYRETVGRGGEGPGEFRNITLIDVLGADSLFVYDITLNRATVFDPATMEAAYTVDRPLGDLHDGRMGIVQAVFPVPGGSGHVGVLRRPYNAGGDSDEARNDIVVSVDGSGSRRDSILVLRSPENLVVRGTGSVTVGAHPFGRTSWVRPLRSDRLVHAHSGRVHVEIADMEGERLHSFSDPLAPAPVTSGQVDSHADERGDALAAALREGGPYVWPVLTGLVVGDAGDAAFWVGLRAAEDGAPSEWAGFTETGRYAGSAFLPSGHTVMAVRDGRMISMSLSELEVPRVHAHRVGMPQ